MSKYLDMFVNSSCIPFSPASYLNQIIVPKWRRAFIFAWFNTLALVL